jgi:hypothetical protein
VISRESASKLDFTTDTTDRGKRTNQGKDAAIPKATQGDVRWKLMAVEFSRTAC